MGAVCQIGDEVWVRGQVTENRRIVVDTVPTSSGTWRHDYLDPVEGSVRTEADFKDPLDEAVLEWATWYIRTCNECGPDASLTAEYFEQLRQAVEARLDASKPKTAEAVIEGLELVGDSSKTWRIDNVDALVIVERLRVAGLLKEDA